MKLRIPILMSVALTAGCSAGLSEESTKPGSAEDWELRDTGAEESVDDDEHVEDTGEALPDRFAPVEGVWTVQESDVISDGCGLEDVMDRGLPGSTMSVSVPNEGRVVFNFHAGDETVRCGVDSETLSYNCDVVETVDTRAADYGLNAQIPVSSTTSGWFVSETEMGQRTDVDLSCQGSDCGLVGLLLGTTFPCNMVVENRSTAGEGLD